MLSRTWNNVQLTVVEFISQTQEPFTIRELSTKFEFQYSSVNNVVQKLVQEGCLTRSKRQLKAVGRPVLIYVVSDKNKIESLRSEFVEKAKIEIFVMEKRLEGMEKRLERMEVEIKKMLDKLFVELEDIRELILTPMKIIRG